MDDTALTINTKDPAPNCQKLLATYKDADTYYDSLTAAMKQYIDIRRAYKDYLLFYRMGDFYELFFDDAVTVSNTLGLTRTSRSRLKDMEIPMCGVPFHAYDMYMSRLIKSGYSVAICEQLTEEEAERLKNFDKIHMDAAIPVSADKKDKNIMKRGVIRLVTPGTLTEETLLDAKRNNYIAAVYVRASEIGLAWLDMSTGAFFMQHLPVTGLPAPALISTTLARLNPVELIIEDRLMEFPQFIPLFAEYRNRLAVKSETLFNRHSTMATLLEAYKVQTLDAFGDFSKAELIAGGVLLEYVNLTQKGTLPKLEMPVHVVGDDLMEIDAATRKSLELLTPTSSTGISLLKVMDKTVTGIGGRLLSERLASPVLNIEEINNRLDAVSFFVENPAVRREIRLAMGKCSDMQRALQRLSMNRGGPRDLYDIAATLRSIPYIQNVVLSFKTYQKNTVCTEIPPALNILIQSIYDHSPTEHEISRALLEDRDKLPLLARTGGFIKEGAYADVDYLKNLKDDAKKRCSAMQADYSEETGVNALKVKDNSVIGYYIEVPSKYADKLFENKKFMHRQSVLNAVRFTTAELCELENEVLASTENALKKELEIFEGLKNMVIAEAEHIRRTSDAIARLDVAAALAELAAEHNYTRPVIGQSLDFDIKEGRHPVVEAVIKKETGEKFITNGCTLFPDTDRIWLLTGPNMAGKSTFLRQNALIAIMAQMGSFVPAQSAKIGIIDKVFSRVGASDDLARGRSTFMVEMVETAAILNRATERSFVILDEIGRGTATFDGLSIAWAVVEQLAEINRCRTIFATHYHELTKLAKQLSCLTLHSMKIKEFNNDIIFMHEVVNGAADRSYGIHVARLAGLPALTVKRAEQVLSVLEEEKQSKILTSIEDELPLFSSLKESIKETPPNQALEALKKLDIDELSPREALNKLYELKAKALES